jgi:hypothetical protein
MLCLSGRVAWGRLTPMDGAGKAPLMSSPIALMLREHAALWRAAAEDDGRTEGLSSEARAVYEALGGRGALFFHELVAATGILRTQVERRWARVGASLVRRTASATSVHADAARKRRSLTVAPAGRSACDVDTAGGALSAVLFPPVTFGALGWRGGGSGQGQEGRVRCWRACCSSATGYAPLARVGASAMARAGGRCIAVSGARRDTGGRFVTGFGGEQFRATGRGGETRGAQAEKSGDLVALSAPIRSISSAYSRPIRAWPPSRSRVLFQTGWRGAGGRCGQPACAFGSGR